MHNTYNALLQAKGEGKCFNSTNLRGAASAVVTPYRLDVSAAVLAASMIAAFSGHSEGAV